MNEQLEQKVSQAIDRIKIANQMSLKYMQDTLYVCISGGKDSSVIQQLAVESGLKCHFIHSLTTVDAPQTVYFIRQEIQRLRDMGYDAKIRMPRISMWKLIEKRYGMPPLRTMRYCCKEFKERPITLDNGTGKKAFIVTGVRWSESVSRKRNRSTYEAIATRFDRRVGINDNDAEDDFVLEQDNTLERKLFEECRLRSERVVNPIIDWTDEDVWAFIKDRNIPYNPLYDMGFKRVGCIGCPLQNREQRRLQFEIWPKYKEAYIKAFDRGLQRAKEAGKEFTWNEGGGCPQVYGHLRKSLEDIQQEARDFKIGLSKQILEKYPNGCAQFVRFSSCP